VGIFKRGQNFYIDYYYGSTRWREKVGPAKGEATKALSIRESEIALGKFKLVREARIPTFREFADEYEKVVSALKRGRAVERYYIQMYRSIFRNKKISEITAQEVERLTAYRARQVKPATVNRELALLKHMFAKAVEWGDVSSNPLGGIRPLKVDKPVERVLELDEEHRLLAAWQLVTTCDQFSCDPH